MQKKPYRVPTIIDLDPCEACLTALRRVLDTKGAEAMANELAPLMKDCAACRAQIPHLGRPDFVVVSNLKTIDGKAAN